MSRRTRFLYLPLRVGRIVISVESGVSILFPLMLPSMQTPALGNRRMNSLVLFTSLTGLWVVRRCK
jgi:hypothetical protein